MPATPLEQPWGYRNKVHFVFSVGDGAGTEIDAPCRWATARGSRRVIPVVECPVHDERGNLFAFAARDIFTTALGDGSPAASLRSLAVRAGVHSGELMATLVVNDDRDRRVRSATRRLIETMQPTSMHLNIHTRDDRFIFGPRTRRLHGPSRIPRCYTALRS